MTEPFDDILLLDDLLRWLREACGAFELVAHWTQGEFHHDLVFRVRDPVPALPGPVIAVSTNCNAGVKELLVLGSVPTESALWRSRCPESSEFTGELPPVLLRHRTVHFFDPCELLADDARSELRPEYRVRQAGGGWRARVREDDGGP